MFCDPFDIPDEVVAAQEEGRLVIFAGAGVSMGPPANLPSFEQLAARIADNTGRVPKPPYDEFLGDLVNDGVEVHRLCREIILAPGSTHNALHTDLLRLFREESRVRVVTSNFDPHFTSAGKALGWNLPVYHAPAVPLGHDFHGLVHLHGSAEGESRRMVLTDVDFGRAYLTDGWASTFLRALFAESVVLFVGYTHSDPPVKYLGRGLVGRRSQGRYALTPETEKGIWRPLGVIPIIYPLQADPAKHGLLPQGIHRWAEIAELQPLAIEAQVQAILTAPADVKPNRSETDVLRRCISKNETVIYFARHAVGLRWVEWLHEQRLLGRYLTADQSVGGTPERYIASWLGDQLAIDATGRGLWLVSQNGGWIGSAVGSSLGYRLVVDASIKLEDAQTQAWIALLADAGAELIRADLLGQILQRLAQKKLWPSALHLFARACRVRVRIEEHFPGFAKEPAAATPVTAALRLRLSGGSIYVTETWDRCFRPAFGELAEALLAILEETVHDAHRLTLALGQGDHRLDRMLYTRSYIESHAEYGGEAELGHLLTWLCEVVITLVKGEPGLDPKRIERWLYGSDPSLVRVGLYALASTKRLSASEKLKWILTGGLLYTPVIGARRELFAVLKAIYGELADEERRELWRQIEAGPPADQFAEVEDEADRTRFAQHEIDRLAWFLGKAFPADDHARGAFERLAARSPKFAQAQHDHIDLDFWSSGVMVGHSTPRTAEQLLEKGPAEQLDYLLNFTSADPFGESREGLVAAVAAAASTNLSWGMTLLRALAERGAWTTDLWAGVFWRLALSSLAVADQKWILENLVGPLSREPETLNVLAHFLFGASLVSNQRPIEPEILDVLFRVSKHLWTAVQAMPAEEREHDFAKTDWLTKAINLPAGRIVEFWLRYIEYRSKAAGRRLEQWPVELVDEFNQIAGAETPADWLGLAVLGRHLDFVRLVAPQWTRERLYPLLDFERMADRAWLLWRTFIGYGQLNRDLILELPPYFAKAFAKFAQAEEEIVRRFFGFVSIIIYSGLWDVNTSGWLRDFLRSISEAQRVIFASTMGQTLRGVPADEMQRLWTKWMRAYWQERLAGRPVPLSAKENGAMADLIWLLPPDEFAEAVGLLYQGPKPAEAASWLMLDRCRENPAIGAQPGAFLRLLRWILESQHHYYGDRTEYEKLLEKLPQTPDLFPLWEAICQVLGQHGIPWAAELLQHGRLYLKAG